MINKEVLEKNERIAQRQDWVEETLQMMDILC